MIKISAFLLALGTSSIALGTITREFLQRRVIGEARTLLETTEVSYVFGGRTLGNGPACIACNTCLAAKSPEPKLRFSACPECQNCSLDCSHFTQLVFQRAGLQSPYLTTSLMAGLSYESLLKTYQFVALNPTVQLAEPGDLLVYQGHVVFLERVVKAGLGDIIHATSGLDLKGPGTAIQRVRFASLANFRGPLLRILRHVGLQDSRVLTGARPHLRPIRPRAENP